MVIISTFLTIHFGTYQLNKLIQVIEHLHNRNQFDNKNRNFQEISVYMCSFSDKKINKLCYCHFNICVLTWFLVPSWTMAFRKFSLVSIFPILFDFFFHEIEFTSCLLVSFTIRQSGQVFPTDVYVVGAETITTTTALWVFWFRPLWQHNTETAWNTHKMNTKHSMGDCFTLVLTNKPSSVAKAYKLPRDDATSD